MVQAGKGIEKANVTETVPDRGAMALRGLETFADITAMFPEGIVDASAVLGDGFAVLDAKDKDQVCGVPLLLIEWDFNPEGKFGEFVIVRAAQIDDVGQIVRKVIIIDGSSTGICRQLKDFTAQYDRNYGMLVRHGLRKSEYEYEELQPDGNVVNKPAVTYYLDLSA
jgi:hypothetical protein